MIFSLAVNFHTRFSDLSVKSVIHVKSPFLLIHSIVLLFLFDKAGCAHVDAKTVELFA